MDLEQKDQTCVDSEQTDRRTDRRTDGRTDGQKDTDGRTDREDTDGRTDREDRPAAVASQPGLIRARQSPPPSADSLRRHLRRPRSRRRRDRFRRRPGTDRHWAVMTLNGGGGGGGSGGGDGGGLAAAATETALNGTFLI